MEKSKKVASEGKRESTSIRFEPKLKYSLEIAARVQRRNLTNYVEWAVEQSLIQVKTNNGETISDMISKIWDIDKDQRIKNIKAHYPDLLTYDEEKRLKELEGK